MNDRIKNKDTRAKTLFKIFLTLLLVCCGFGASAQWIGVTGPAQKNSTTGEYRWNFGVAGLFEPDSLFLMRKDSTTKYVTPYFLSQNYLPGSNSLKLKTLHYPVKYATTILLDTVTYNNGSAGVGATLTSTHSLDTLYVDGYYPANGDRVLIGYQADSTQNGIYTVTQNKNPFILTRDRYASIDSNMVAGSSVIVQNGLVNAGAQYFQQTPGDVTFGTTKLAYFSPTLAKVGPAVRSTSLLENKQALRDFGGALYNYYLAADTSYVGVAYWGDSVSPHVSLQLVKLMGNYYPISNNAYPATLNGGLSIVTHSGSILYNIELSPPTANQNVLDGTGGTYDFTWKPSADHTTLGNGGSITIGNSTASYGAFKGQVYLGTSPTLGSVFVELVNSNTGVTEQSKTVNCYSASMGATSVTFRFNPLNPYNLRMTSTGTTVLLLEMMFKNKGGIIPVNFGLGGSTLLQNNFCNKTVLNYLCNQLNVKLLVTETKEENPTASYPPTFSTFKAITSTPSILVIGSLPDGGNVPSQIWQHSLLRSYAINNDCAYYDGYKAIESFYELNRLGWIIGATHPSPIANMYVAADIWGEMGYNDYPGTVNKRQVDQTGTTNSIITNKLTLITNQPSQSTNDIIVPAGGSLPNSVNIQYLNRVIFGAPGTASIPAISQYDATTIAYSDNLTSVLDNIRVGGITQATSTTANSISGKIALSNQLVITGTQPAPGAYTTNNSPIFDNQSVTPTANSQTVNGGIDVNSTLNVGTGILNATGTIAGGSGYTNGTYTNVPLTGGSPTTQATATIIVAGGSVTTVNINIAGVGYSAANTISAAASFDGVGSGSGFTLTGFTLGYTGVSMVNAVFRSAPVYFGSISPTTINNGYLWNTGTDFFVKTNNVTYNLTHPTILGAVTAGSVPLSLITGGTRTGKIALVAGVATVTISGITSSSIPTSGFISLGGTVSTTWRYQLTCTTNTLTITAITTTGTTDTSDTSTISYHVIN